MTRAMIRIAIAALRAYAKRFAFDANLFERGISDSPTAENAAAKIIAIRSAIIELENYLPTKKEKHENYFAGRD